MKSLLFAMTLCVAQLGAAEKGFISLFNGKDLSGWQGMEGPTTNWEVKDGILSCTGKQGSHWLATKKEFSNFDLRLEYKIPTDGNSGVFIRAPKEGNPWVTGLEIQVLDDYGPKWKDLKPNQFTGAVYAVLAPSERATKKADEWQTVRIRCSGSKCRVWVNGKQIIKADLAKLAEKTKTVPGLKRIGGFIGLQNHSSPVFYRNIRVKELK